MEITFIIRGIAKRKDNVYFIRPVKVNRRSYKIPARIVFTRTANEGYRWKITIFWKSKCLKHIYCYYTTNKRKISYYIGKRFWNTYFSRAMVVSRYFRQCKKVHIITWFPGKYLSPCFSQEGVTRAASFSLFEFVNRASLSEINFYVQNFLAAAGHAVSKLPTLSRVVSFLPPLFRRISRNSCMTH